MNARRKRETRKKEKINDEEEVTLEFGERKNDGTNRYSPSGDFIEEYEEFVTITY